MLSVLLLLALCRSGAAETPATDSRNIYMFVGRHTAGTMRESANTLNADYEDNYLVAAAWGKDLFMLDKGFSTGGELGLAYRFGDSGSVELWGGISLRHRGVSILKAITVSPAVTVGISLTNKSIGAEHRRENGRGQSARILFYLGPEIAFSMPSHPRWELVYRLHHRSGGNQTLGNVLEGHNANTIGVRHRF